MQVGDHIPLDAHVLHVKGHPRRGNGIEAGGVVHKVGSEGTACDLFLREVAGQLVENGGDHLKVGEFFGALRSIGNVSYHQMDQSEVLYWVPDLQSIERSRISYN